MIELREYDPAEYLTDDETITHYLSLAADDPNPAVLRQALGNVMRATAQPKSN